VLCGHRAGAPPPPPPHSARRAASTCGGRGGAPGGTAWCRACCSAPAPAGAAAEGPGRIQKGNQGIWSGDEADQAWLCGSAQLCAHAQVASTRWAKKANCHQGPKFKHCHAKQPTAAATTPCPHLLMRRVVRMAAAGAGVAAGQGLPTGCLAAAIPHQQAELPRGFDASQHPVALAAQLHRVAKDDRGEVCMSEG
jgi:hypothetical protein